LFVYACATVLAFSCPVAAQQFDLTKPPTPEEMKGNPVALREAMVRFQVRTILESGNVNMLEARFVAYEQAPGGQESDYDTQRSMFRMFAVTNPQIVEFAEKWVETLPSSPYAHTALAWTYWARGRIMRGEGLPKYIYPEAARLSKSYFAKAMEHAEKAYELAPEVVGASDLMLITSLHVRGTHSESEILDTVMGATPNRTTLIKAGIAHSSRWGGKLSGIARICKKYAALVPTEKDYTADVCTAEIANEAYMFDRDVEAVSDIVMASDHPRLAKARRDWLMRIHDTSPETQRMLELYLFDVTVLDVDAASYLDRVFYLRDRRPLIGAEVMLRKVLKAREDLVYDPGNQTLIRLALTTELNERKVATPLTAAERRGIYREALKASPYSADFWFEYTESLGPDVGRIPSLGEPFYQNAVVYSNHGPYYTGLYANGKALMYDRLLFARKWPGSEFGGMPTIDYHAEADEILCPFVRAARIYAAQCPEGAGSSDYCNVVTSESIWNAAIRAARSEPSCKSAFELPLDKILFTEQKVDWAVYDARAAE
jgi:hypothetical protein